MHSYRNLLPLLLLVWATHCFSSSSIEGMRSNDVVHGLYEIREEARKFVAQENARTRGKWEASEPNLKVLVPRCATHLKARWDAIWWFNASKSGEPLQRSSRRVIAVVCTRTASAPKDWVVHVPAHQRK
jgi:hypothetical protein